MIKRYTDQEVEQLLDSRSITKEILRGMTLDQQNEIFKKAPDYYHALTATKEKGLDELTVLDFDEMDLEQRNKLYKEAPSIYQALSNELKEVKIGWTLLQQDLQKYEKLFRQKGISPHVKSFVSQFRKDTRVGKHYEIFEAAVNSVLAKDRTEILKYKGEEIIKLIGTSFNNKLYERGYRIESGLNPGLNNGSQYGLNDFYRQSIIALEKIKDSI